MKICIESTSKIVQLADDEGNMLPARIWEGVSENGVKLHCYITRLAIDATEPPEKAAIFERELREERAPSAAIAAIPLRLIL